MKSPIPCVRIIIEDPQNKILLLKRDNSQYGLGKWCLPGGKVDHGQTLKQACQDEIKEETGLKISDLKYLFYQDNLPKKGDPHYLNHYFHAKTCGEVKLNDESSDSIWIAPKEIDNYEIVFRNTEGIKLFLSKK